MCSFYRMAAGRDVIVAFESALRRNDVATLESMANAETVACVRTEFDAIIACITEHRNADPTPVLDQLMEDTHVRNFAKIFLDTLMGAVDGEQVTTLTCLRNVYGFTMDDIMIGDWYLARESHPLWRLAAKGRFRMFQYLQQEYGMQRQHVTPRLLKLAAKWWSAGDVLRQFFYMFDLTTEDVQGAIALCDAATEAHAITCLNSLIYSRCKNATFA